MPVSGRRFVTAFVFDKGKDRIWGRDDSSGPGAVDRRMVYGIYCMDWDYVIRSLGRHLPTQGKKGGNNSFSSFFIIGNGGGICICIKNGRDTLR